MENFIQESLLSSQTDFLAEIFLRTIIMFLLVLSVLRILGRRGVRQLTFFEMAMVISLGSAAGDPMFQDDLPIIHAVIVLLTVVLLYKAVTWTVRKFRPMEQMLEGSALTIIWHGMFHMENGNRMAFSRMEFFSELRNLNVEHLGQVKEGVLEVDGTLSLIFYPPEEVKYGLPIFPSRYREISKSDGKTPIACMFCGNVLESLPEKGDCPRCAQGRWAVAIRDLRI
ncbi:DUF421 domain-containing protein [Sphingobacterium sp. 1.A.4]|uniref:DUF421 domain-containing protein n=1 Tax=Sphingobacterium sp. 1.A.4 TaxID=2044603 RepID=UPI000C0BF0BE|nr:YetF domain-containing protein [Sphingobacterium sp. 1.A.4]